jgi:predicted RNase H-like nuclease (RuvC/YqgF family)
MNRNAEQSPPPSGDYPQLAGIANDEKAGHASSHLPEIEQRLYSLEKEREALIDQINAQQTKIYLLTDSHALLRETQNTHAQLERAHETLQEDYQNLEQSFQRLVNQYQGLERTLHGLIHSHSWRVTAPLRSLLQLLPRRFR